MNAFDITLTDPDGGGDDYYHVIVTQTDDWDGNGRNDETVSAPIRFFDAPPPARPACGALAGTNGAAPGTPGLAALLVPAREMLALFQNAPGADYPSPEPQARRIASARAAML